MHPATPWASAKTSRLALWLLIPRRCRQHSRYDHTYIPYSWSARVSSMSFISGSLWEARWRTEEVGVRCPARRWEPSAGREPAVPHRNEAAADCQGFALLGTRQGLHGVRWAVMATRKGGGMVSEDSSAAAVPVGRRPQEEKNRVGQSCWADQSEFRRAHARSALVMNKT